ncbi:hypothetical protein QYE76_070557 [Lolium multiflorum]|uniref:Retrotransposon gag domain-containing protein n=1 Tax=Lolium multiflorum TaxID=4521 RepID=A0AAD8SKE6_LOLMU|nr:hypothetical protein QYE76_070557 [Lolium multiflorum]
MGLEESISATTCHLLGTGAGSVRRSHAGAGTKTASPSLAEAKGASLNLGGAGTKSARLSLAGNDGGDHHQEEGVTEAGASREQRRESEGGRSSYRPPRRSRATWRRRWRRRRRPRSRRPRHPAKSRDAGTLNEYRSDYIGPSERPDTWIEDYYNARTLRRNPEYSPHAPACTLLVQPVWLSDLEENTVFCWFDPKKAFENHFKGTYKRPATTSDLQACIQKKGETSRSFLTRWLATKNECENVDNRTAMHAFIGGLQRGGLLRHKLTCLVNANKLTLDEMINIARSHCANDDAAEISQLQPYPHQQKKTVTTQRIKNKRKNPPKTERRRIRHGCHDVPTWRFRRRKRPRRGGGAGWASSVPTRSPQPDPAPPKRTKNTGICRARLIWIRYGKSTHTNRNCKWVNDLKNDPEAGYKRARSTAHAAKEARARTKTRRRTVPRLWTRMTLGTQGGYRSQQIQSLRQKECRNLPHFPRNPTPRENRRPDLERC